GTPLPTPTPVPVSLSQPALPLSTGVRFSRATTTDTGALDTQVKDGKLDGYVTVEGTRASDATFTYHAKDRPSQTTSARLLALLTAALLQARLKENGITPRQAAQIFASPALKVEAVVPGTLKDEKALVQSVALVYVLLILLYITILMYGIQVAMGV